MASKPDRSGRKSMERPWEDITPEEFDGIRQRLYDAMRAACLQEPAETRFEMEMLGSLAWVEMGRHRPKHLHVVHDQPVPADHSGPVPYWGRD